MEHPKADTEGKTESKVEDPNLKPQQQLDPKPAGHAPNGDGNKSIFSAVSEDSGPQIQNETQGGQATGQAPSRSASGSRKSVHWSPELVNESPAVDHKDKSSSTDGYNPYVARSPAATPASHSFKDRMESVKGVLGRWGRKVGEATRKAEDLAGNTWQHLKTAPSFADAAMGRIAQSTKVLAEGGYEKIFRQTFETVPEEHLQNSYACYLSTSAGPVMGTLYISTAKIAYCSDNPLSYKSGGQTEWSYYKVVIPLHQLKAVNPSTSRDTAEKYMQVISVDNHEFWFMGFLNYHGAVNSLQEALQSPTLPSV